MRAHGSRAKPSARRRPAEPQNSNLRLGAAVRRRRKALGLTQQELGRLAGCGLAFLYELEAGKPTVRLDKLLAVLKVLGLELVLESGREGLRIHRDLEEESG